MSAYDQYINGDLRNYQLTDEDLEKGLARVPHII